MLSTLRLLKDPRRWYGRWRDRYGDPFTVPAANGTVVVSGTPAGIRQILSAKPEVFDPFAVASLESLFGQHMILTMTGKAHLRERKLMMPPFHGERMRAYAELIREVATRHAAAFTPDRELTALAFGTAVSREVILRAVFGVDAGDTVERFGAAIEGVAQRIHPLLLFSTALHRPLLGLSPYVALRRAALAFDELMYAEIARRRAAGNYGEDICSLLMTARYEDGSSMSDEHLRDELLALFFAGHETTAVSLSWAMFHLHRNPACLARLREELDALGDAGPEQIASNEYLVAVCNETLRMFPILPDVLRTLKQDFELEGHTIPAGYAVAAGIVLLHDDPELYPEPGVFRPERFLERRYRPWEFMPFGGGHRRCIGAAFASYEMALVLATVLRQHRFELIDPDQVVATRRNVTMGPNTGVRMRYLGPRASA